MNQTVLVQRGQDKITDCAIGAVVVTLDALRDTPSRGLYVGGTGNVSCLLADGATVLFTAMAAGVIHPISVLRVNTSGTTATSLLYTV